MRSESISSSSEKVSPAKRLAVSLAGLALIVAVGCNHESTSNEDTDLHANASTEDTQSTEITQETAIIYGSEPTCSGWDGTITVYLGSGGLFDHETEEGYTEPGQHLVPGPYENPHTHLEAGKALCGEDYELPPPGFTPPIET